MLRRLAAEPQGLSFGELAQQVGLARSTAHRILEALRREGFIRKTAAGRLHIGPDLIAIALASRRDLRREAAPYLERLSHELQETVDLAVLDGHEVLFVDQFVSRRNLHIVAEIGARFPLYCSASGKALLGALPPEQAEGLLPERLTPLTAKTISERRKLLAELAQVRRSGIAYDHEEHDIGIAAMGTAVSDASGDLAAIAVVLPAGRLAASRERIAEALLRTRDEIHAALRRR